MQQEKATPSDPVPQKRYVSFTDKFSGSLTHCSTLFCGVPWGKASPSDPVSQRRHVFVTYKNDTGSFLCARVIAPVNSSQQETASPRPCPHFLLKQIHSCTRALHCSCRLLAGDGFAAALSSRSAYTFCFKTNSFLHARVALLSSTACRRRLRCGPVPQKRLFVTNYLRTNSFLHPRVALLSSTACTRRRLCCGPIPQKRLIVTFCVITNSFLHARIFLLLSAARSRRRLHRGPVPKWCCVRVWYLQGRCGWPVRIH